MFLLECNISGVKIATCDNTPWPKMVEMARESIRFVGGSVNIWRLSDNRKVAKIAEDTAFDWIAKEYRGEMPCKSQ